MQVENLSQSQLQFAEDLLKALITEGFTLKTNTIFHNFQLWECIDTGRVAFFRVRRFSINGAKLTLIQSLTYVDSDGMSHYLDEQ